MAEKAKIYFDTCCYNRPFNLQKDSGVREETEAILEIYDRVQKDEIILVSSELVRDEITATSITLLRDSLLLFLKLADDEIVITEKIQSRAAFLKGQSLRDADALHLAIAENANATLLTVDKRFLNKVKKLEENLKIKMFNPVDYLKILKESSE